MVLGTSRFLSDGGRNEYFHNRIAAAAELYRQGKASYFLVSGDNATLSYNEPREMRRARQRAPAAAGRPGAHRGLVLARRHCSPFRC